MRKINNILMIDDNEADHIIAKFTVEAYDSTICMHSAYDGQEALELLETVEQTPDIIFVDINMPGMNGYEFLAEYDKNKSNDSTIIMMLTSSDQESDKQKCFSYSFVQEYIVKPLELEHFEAIAKHL